MSTIPSLALIPSGVKASKVYSVLPTDGSGDFDFTRSGNATRVNSEGLIELVTSNVPRLNYPLIDGVVSGCPSLLLEPERTNLVTYSEDFSNSYWVKTNTNTSNSVISPDGGLNGTKYTLDATSSRSQISRSIFSIGTLYTTSVFVKYDSVKYFYISNAGADAYRVVFDIENGIIVSNGASITSSKIENYGNGWYRCSSVFTAAYSTLYLQFSPNSNGATFTNTTDFSYIYGVQLEAGSYPTSYIPTSGTTATRSAEICNNAGDVNTFNDSEGVLFAEISALASTVPTYTSIGLGSGSSNNRIGFGFVTPSNIYVFKRTTSSWNTNKLVNINESNKVAISYNTNDNHFWLNGFKIASDATIGDLVQPTGLGFRASYGGEQFYGNTKQIQYFNTALNDSDLETLTSWDSFSDMAIGQLYTIE